MNERALNPHSDEPIRIGDAINMSLELAEKCQTSVPGIPSGFPSMDRLTQGWGKGELIVIGGRPGSGKTALALGLARNAAVEFGVPTAYFTLETPLTDLTDRLIVSESGIPMEKLQGASRMMDEDWQRLESSLKRLSDAPLYIDDSPLRAPLDEWLEDFWAKVGTLKKEKGMNLFIVDDMQAATPDWMRHELYESNQTARFLKNTAWNYGVAIIALTNVERPKRRINTWPVIRDLDMYCPHAEDRADKIILLNRPSLSGPAPCMDESGIESLQLRVAQNKSGHMGTVDLLFDPGRIRVINPEFKYWKTDLKQDTNTALFGREPSGGSRTLARFELLSSVNNH